MSEKVYQQEVDGTTTPGVTYVGESEPGVSTTQAKWRIKQITQTGDDVSIKYPVADDGSPKFTEEFIWSRRDDYVYSNTDDRTAPTLSTVTIASDNATTTLAKVGDTITLTIVSSEPIREPAVVIAGNEATVVEGVEADFKHWTATYDMQSSDTNGNVTFSVNFLDLGGNGGVPVSATTDLSAVTFDKTVPTLPTVSMASNNVDPTVAVTGDIITLTIVASESLKAKPVVTIATHAIDPTDVVQGVDAEHWTATYTMVGGDSAGAVAFTVDFEDLAGNDGIQASVVTVGTPVTFTP